jgi:hypothetical protein
MLPGRFVARSGSKLGAPAVHTQSRSNVACHSVENSRRKRKSNAGGFCHLPRPRHQGIPNRRLRKQSELTYRPIHRSAVYEIAPGRRIRK